MAQVEQARMLEAVESAAVHVRELEAAGFDVEMGAAGVATAFVAERRFADGPVVGFLSEYDALPGLGNEAVPRQEPRADGNTNGHGCGHNLLGAGFTGAAIAAATVLEENDIPGTVRVYGCAAEETGARRSTWLATDSSTTSTHVPTGTPVVARRRHEHATRGGNAIRIAFHGKTAHAAMEPWSGRSALDGLELTAHGLNLMREHVEPTARLHYIHEHWNTPTMGVVMPTAPLGVSMHTWPVTACGGTSIGLKGAVAAAQVLALTALDVLTDEALRTDARTDFERRTNGFEYVSPLTAEQLGPRGFRLPVSAP